MKLSNKDLLTKLNPAIEYAKNALLVGILQKNIVKHFTNLGLTTEASLNIVELGVCRAEKLSHYKLK